jgi:hypothetical protein
MLYSMDARMISKYTKESNLLNLEIGVFNQYALKINLLKQKINLSCDTLRIYFH